MYNQKMTYAVAKEWLRYEPETGDIYWTKDLGKRRAGKIAGGSLMKGYKRLRIDHEVYAHHRVAWLLMTGEWPNGSIDHANHIRTDNRWSNLRLATDSQNSANNLRQGKAGLPKGVRRSYKRFSAQGWANGRVYYLGSYSTADEAHKAYIEFASRAHGEYACISEADTAQQAALRAEAAKAAGRLRIPQLPRGPTPKPNALPRGVYRSGSRFGAQGWSGGKRHHLGRYDTKEQAHEAYLRFYKEAFGGTPSPDPDQNLFTMVAPASS